MAKFKNIYNNLIGYQLPHKLGNIDVIAEATKTSWNNELLINKSVSKVYKGIFNVTNYEDNYFNKTEIVYIPLLKITNQFLKFKKEFFNNFLPNSFTIMGGSFDNIAKYGYEIGKEGHPAITINVTEEMINCNFGDYELAFTPYNDGIMLVHLMVDKSERGNGTGTFVMNKLYDISEKINVPIYLTPYPSEEFISKDEKELVDRLKNYYTRIGFGPVSEDSLVWCNFE